MHKLEQALIHRRALDWCDSQESVRRHPDVNVIVNFASFRSVHETVTEMLKFPEQVRTPHLTHVSSDTHTEAYPKSM